MVYLDFLSTEELVWKYLYQFLCCGQKNQEVCKKVSRTDKIMVLSTIYLFMSLFSSKPVAYFILHIIKYYYELYITKQHEKIIQIVNTIVDEPGTLTQKHGTILFVCM
jgi:hypothetical protein